MSHARDILQVLDEKLNSPVELTLYGRAALQLGFDPPLEEHALSRDVDAVLWLGQAEELKERTNFWEAVEAVNRELAERELYVSHFFTEDQVILQPDWKEHRVRIPGPWRHLDLYRLGNLDLLLTKLMRDDPLDRKDALFIVARSGLRAGDIETALHRARVPETPEIQEQFRDATRKLLEALRS